MQYHQKIDDYFKISASLQPSAPAIITDDLLLTYSELDAASDRLAVALQSRGIMSEESIGVLTERSADLPAAFLAILKAGGVYVPMAADLPPERLANMAEQAALRILIVLDGIAVPSVLTEALLHNGAISPSDAVLRPGELSPPGTKSLTSAERNGGANALAAILFTSGSSGTPKGVPLTHAACVNMVLGHIEAHHITSEDRILLSSSPVFILGFRTLCIPLISGSAFVPVSRSVVDRPDLLIELMSRHHVSIALFTPSYLHLLDRAVPEGLRCVITAGELPNADDARYYAEYVDYWNVHGATEVCGTICMHHVDPDETGTVLSGRPFANTEVYLLDEEGNEVPQGEIGEVHVVGVGVSPGYLKQPELNAEYFIETRYGRAFRSRDLARWNSNGELETLGRSDNAVKISGQAVSLDEIELALQRHPAVKIAKVLHLKKMLYAFVESHDLADAKAIAWREFLQRTLPSYMIPAHVVVLEKMPLSSAGKVDQRALQEIAEGILFNGAGEGDCSTPPEGDIEKAIASIWEELLDVRPIMREQNFFAAGGTSLLAIAVSQRLHLLGYHVPVQMVLSTLSIRGLAEKISEIELQPELPGNQDQTVSDIATADQEDFWIASELDLDPAASHIVRVLYVRGREFSNNAWQSAWAGLIDRHAALRTALYADESGRICWRTVSSCELSAHAALRIDHCHSGAEGRSIAERRANDRFKLDDPPLARAGIVRIEESRKTLFWFVLHHSVVDGTSAKIIQDDLLSLLGGVRLQTAPNGIAMASRAERLYLHSGKAERDRIFWSSSLEALAARASGAFSEYVTEHQRPALSGSDGDEPLVEQLDAATVSTLGRLAKRCGTGLHALLLAVLASEIRRRSGKSDILIGSGITIRPAGDENAVGHFVNLLPVILLKDGDLPFSLLLRTTQSALTETVEHAAYPAGMLYREFRRSYPDLRAPSRTSLFDIALTAIPSRTSIDRKSGITLEPLTLTGEDRHPAAGLDLSFSHEPSAEESGALNLLLSWNAEVISIEGARAWLSSFAAWARWLAEDPERMEQPLPALLPEEQELLRIWENGAKQIRTERRSHELFEVIVDHNPCRPAIIIREKFESFMDLDLRANGIAACLKSHGVVRGTVVAVLASAPGNLPATVLAIWKAGGSYLPFSADIPAARLATMARDARAKHLIVLDGLTTPEALSREFDAIIRPEDSSPSALRPEIDGTVDDVAYIIYTSGTTGTPKGVPVTHAAYINTIVGVAERIGLRDDDRIALVSTITFDASLWEMGHGFFSGIAMVPVAPALREDPWQMKPYYRDLGVTVAFHTPSYLRVSEKLPFEGLRILLTGGEAPNHNDVALYAGSVAFWNFYGPTEATIVVSGALIPGDHDPRCPISVGTPLSNMQISVRRDDGSPVPPCAEGEIWLGGLGIARGYLNQPEESAMHFVESPEGLFYRSGDYGRWSREGQLEISGRIDQQIKLNGQRVEPGEIEQMLSLHPSVVTAVVLADELQSGVKVLRAFVQPENMSLFSEAKLLDYLSGHLSLHMVPASIMAVAVIPLTPSGKVDRMALFSSLQEKRKSDVHVEMLQSPLERKVGAIWADLLEQSVVGSDNFFALGGNSLLAVTVAHRIRETLGLPVSARALFAAPTLRMFVATIATLEPLSQEDAVEEESALASEGEHEFWIAESAGLDTRNFIIPVDYLISREITTDRLQSAWAILVKRHEALRSSFAEDETGQLRRHIADDVEWTLESSQTFSRADALGLIRERQFTSISMSATPLWRAGLVETAEGQERFFWLALHHALGDGQSIATLLSELTTLLQAGELSGQVKGGKLFAAREYSYLASPEATKEALHWKNLLHQVPDPAFEEWPLDMARSSRSATGSHRFELLLECRTADVLKALARNNGATLHSLILSLLALEAGRRTGRSDIMIGTTASLRERASDSLIVGYGVNMLPLHLKAERQRTFSELLQSTQQHLAEALQHARLPFSRICHSFWNDRPQLRNPQRYPLFDIAVTENPGSNRVGGASCFSRSRNPDESIRYEFTGNSPGQDMVLIHENLERGEILLQWHVNAAIYSQETARIWLEALRGWARWLAESKENADRPLPSLLKEELCMLGAWQQGEMIERPQLCVHHLFERITGLPGQAGRPAVITPDRQITYRELDNEADAIAHALSECGVSKGSVVAVLTGRSPNLPAALLGIWKSGAIYLPLSVELPPERIGFMAEDAGATHLIVLDGVALPEVLSCLFSDPLRPEELTGEYLQQYAQRAENVGDPEDTAYILYTSGSTGRPKGTLIAHKSLVNMVLGAAAILGFNADDRSLLFASPSFDVSLSDIGLPLLTGGTICAVPKHIIESPKRFLDFLQEMRITVADITPTYLGLFEGMELPSSVRVLVTGGEAPLPADVYRYAPKLSYFNAYGPTENTITSTMGVLTGDDRRFLSCGRPLPNTTLFVCNEEGSALAPGVAGEVWLGGLGISQGYLNRPELNASCFRESPHGRLYRTGDLGRWHMDGTIEIIGRIDEQVKLNGIRIEPGEIEYALMLHPAISQAVVLLQEQPGGAKSLWGVVRPAPGEQMPGMDAWKTFLMERLPSHMIPSGVISVDSIPLMVSGKVDRGALLDLLDLHPLNSGLTLPEDELESSIAGIWSDLLKRTPIHREDNFFALGGHSLLAISVAHRLEKQLGREVPARELFAEPTLAGFSERVRELRATEEGTLDGLSDLATEGQREFWTAEHAGLDTSGFNIPLTLLLHLEAPSPEKFSALWSELIERHEALRTGFLEDESGLLRRVVSDKVDALPLFQFSSTLQEARALANSFQSEPFSMSQPGLWRAGLITVGENPQSVFWFVMHHAVGDGLSLGILIDELSALLTGSALSVLSAGFDRPAAREAAYLESSSALFDAEYWNNLTGGLLKHSPEAFDEWPLDSLRPNSRSASSCVGSHCLRTILGRETANGLRSLAKRNRSTLHAFMLALLGLEVRRRTGRNSFMLGTAASTRQSGDEMRTIGYFINMLPLVFRAPESPSVDAVVQQMQHQLAEALQHSRYPFSRIYSDFRRNQEPGVHPGRYPLFDIAVTENPPFTPSEEREPLFSGLGLPEYGVVGYEVRKNAPAQDMVLVHEGEADGGVVLTFYVNAVIYSESSARRMFDSLIGWMRFLSMENNGGSPPLPLLLPEEEAQLACWQQGALRTWPAKTLPEHFLRIASLYPGRPAVVTAGAELSFHLVNTRAETLARVLLKRDVQPGDTVAVLTERSTTLQETVLAIWKAGACYLALSADLPPQRLAFMARECSVRVIIALDQLPLPPELGGDEFHIVRPEEMPNDPADSGELDRTVAPDDPAYIIYTSGSTGLPKGVVLSHRGLLNLGFGESEIFDLHSDDRVMQIASPSFDLWISDLAVSWAAGAALVPVRREEMNDIPCMHDLIRHRGVTIATMSPSYLRLFEQAEFPAHLRLIMTVGESPVSDDARYYAPKLSYFNGYGPTENTAASSLGRILPDQEAIHTGRPLPNTTIYITSEEGKPLPPGSIGDVWVGGASLAKGYLNRPDLTASAFLFVKGERRYRTGDLGRWLPSGELQILGRRDTQVKLRGQRVELGEIEHRLASWPGIQQAVTIVETDADHSQFLRSFVTADEEASIPTYVEWTTWLSATLPSWMIPASIIRIPSIPLTPAGKVDREALLESQSQMAFPLADEGSESEHQFNRTPPQSAIEKRISEVWSELLRKPMLSREDHFFDIGGDSLKAIAVINRLGREFECTVNNLYEHPVLSDFALLCNPRPDHLRNLLLSLSIEQECSESLQQDAGYDQEELLRPQRLHYEERVAADLKRDLRLCRSYRHLLLTGATGYLGSYLLRELLADKSVEVTVLVRSSDTVAGRRRLAQVLNWYFGPDEGSALLENPRLKLLSGDLRHAQLLLREYDYSLLSDTVDAIYHCAANVNHIGHYRDFLADNVSATRHLLRLAAQQSGKSADFHFVSTLSVAASALYGESRLFTEYDSPPEVLDDNYYIRSKQEAERLVLAYRSELPDCTIHRVGNISFAAKGSRLQQNIRDNAFFRQLAAFIRLGVVPMEFPASLSHVDLVARSIIALSERESLANEIHHIETSRRDSLADVILPAEGMRESVRACSFGDFLARLQEATGEHEMESAVAETVENFGLQSANPGLAGRHKVMVVSKRTLLLLENFGITWPSIPKEGLNALLAMAMEVAGR